VHRRQLRGKPNVNGSSWEFTPNLSTPLRQDVKHLKKINTREELTDEELYDILNSHKGSPINQQPAQEKKLIEEAKPSDTNKPTTNSAPIPPVFFNDPIKQLIDTKEPEEDWDKITSEEANSTSANYDEVEWYVVEDPTDSIDIPALSPPNTQSVNTPILSSQTQPSVPITPNT
jgi:hypothetical protein